MSPALALLFMQSLSCYPAASVGDDPLVCFHKPPASHLSSPSQSSFTLFFPIMVKSFTHIITLSISCLTSFFLKRCQCFYLDCYRLFCYCYGYQNVEILSCLAKPYFPHKLCICGFICTIRS